MFLIAAQNPSDNKKKTPLPSDDREQRLPKKMKFIFLYKNR